MTYDELWVIINDDLDRLREWSRSSSEGTEAGQVSFLPDELMRFRDSMRTYATKRGNMQASQHHIDFYYTNLYAFHNLLLLVQDSTKNYVEPNPPRIPLVILVYLSDPKTRAELLADFRELYGKKIIQLGESRADRWAYSEAFRSFIPLIEGRVFSALREFVSKFQNS